MTPRIGVGARGGTGESPRLRWPGGPTAVSGGRLRPFVPDRLYEWIMRFAFRTRRTPRIDRDRHDPSLRL